MNPTLTGKRSLVTGAASGIGRAAAVRLAAGGAEVALLDVDLAGAEAVGAEIEAAGGVALAVHADVSDEPSVSAAVATVVAAFGGLDVVVANAGVELTGRDARVHELSLEAWNQTLGINLTGCFLTCKHTVPHLIEAGGGSIVITGSPDGMYGLALGAHAYSASKGGCHGLMRIMAAEYAADRIRVNAVIPGWIDTPINHTLMAQPGGIEADLAKIPLPRIGKAEEVAAAIAFLAGDESTYTTGSYLHVDGGLTAV